MSEPEFKDDMTTGQREALEKAWNLLTEFFERCLVVVDYDVDEPGKKPQQAHEGFWHGGALSGIGMAEFAKDRIMRSGSSEKSNEPDEPDYP